jgi:hypothetical protein
MVRLRVVPEERIVFSGHIPCTVVQVHVARRISTEGRESMTVAGSNIFIEETRRYMPMAAMVTKGIAGFVAKNNVRKTSLPEPDTATVTS